MKKTATQLLCTVLVLCMCLALIPMRANAASGTAAKLDAAYEEARLASYDQFLAYYYLTFSSLDFFLENEQLPFQCYVELADDDFRSELNAWRILTMNAGDQLTYSAAEVEFYEFLIFDILYQEIAEDELLNNAQTGADAFQFSLLKKLADAGFAWSNSMALTSENTEAVVSAMIATDDLKFLAGCGEIIEKGIEYTQTMEHLIEKLYMLVKLNECTEEVCTILDDLYENATNDLMKEACRKMTLVATGLLDEAEIMAIFSGEVALSEVVEYSTDKIWDGLLATTSFGQGIAIGQGVGKLACNLMWSTDAVVENWYSMEKVHIFEQVLKNRVKVYMQRFENNPTLENAKLFNKAADMYLNTLSVGMKYGIQFFEAARGGGFTGWLYKNLFEPEAYEKALGELHTIKNSIDLAINLANNNTYNFYLEELEADIETEVEWVETPCETDEEEVRDTLATLPEILFMLTNQTVTGDTTLTDDQTTYGNYSFSNGSLDLAGHTLTVYGDFYLNGTLNVNGGTLDVRGDLNVTHGYLRLNGGTVNVGGDAIFASKKSDGSYGTTVPDTRLIMNNEADQFIAVGDLITYFDTYYSNGMDCSAGEMRIGGNWINYGSDDKKPNGTFRMIFTGMDDLTINGTDDIYVPTLVIENASQRSITMRGTVSAGTLEGGDMTITAKDSPNLSFNTTTGKLDIRGYTTLSVSTAAGGNITFSEGAHLKEIDLCGHSIQVNGDLQISESVSLGYLATETVGSLTVTGDLHVTHGNLKLNGGTVNVGGDMLFAWTNDDGSYGPTSNYTYLTMDNDADRFTVTGNLVTYFANYSTVGLVCSTGEMKIGGGWTHYDAFRNPSGTFRMIFTGTNDLTINGMDDIYVPTVVIENAGQRSITMRGTVSAGTLEGGDMSITAKDSPTISFATTDGDIGLIGSLTLAVSTRAGGDITVDGDLYSKGIAMGANTLTINGDLHMDSNCPLAIGFSGKLIVNGDVWMRTGTLTLSGVTEISGSLYQAGGEVKPNKGQVEIKGDYRIQTWDESSGEMEWTESSGKLYMTNEKDSIVVGGDFYMQSDKSHGSLLTAGCLAVHGDFYQLAGSGYNFAASGTHTVFLCGKYHQSASFESGTSMFNILRLNKPKEYYTFIPDPCWKTLIEGDETPETPTSGTCGENLTWTFDRETSTLTISGTGEMDDYSWQSGNEAYAPWYVWSEQITSIVIEEGVASIGAYAFYDCTDVGEITFLGDAPAMREAIFGGVTATAYYPADNDTWAEDVMQDYGGTITWVLYGDADPHIHNYSEAVTPPTCTEQGFTTYTCACGEQYVDNYVDALGHTLGDWYVVKAPTVDEEGEERRGCENCDYFETRSTDKLPDSEDPEIIASGSCGDGVNWTLYSDGLLVIYGTGAMDDYAWNTQPWNAYLDQILRVEIKEGVTSIGEGTFWDCSGLTVITIPDSLASIGEDAFRACSSLTEITIPDGVASISDSVFQSCTGLTKITIPEGVTSIGDSAFAYCSSLTEITIPDSVTNIGNWVFRSCSSLTEINIPDGVTSISDYVFYGCSNLTEITIPNGVTSIGNCAFRDCSSLTEITVPDGVTSIEDSAFCDCTSLTEINIPDGVTYISAYVFSGCSSLAEITIPDGVTSIGNYAFASMSCLTEITIPDDVISIGYGAFMSCSGLTEITVPDSITSIDDHVFYGCYRLTEITFLGDAPTIADESFRDIRATAYYPAGNDTWTENVRQDYGGIITWEPWGEEEKPTSGTCGGMLTWTYDPKTDTLTITGIGAMFDYIIGNLLDTPVCTANTESAGEAPWAHWSGEISIIVIGEGVTSIGDNAFYMCGVSDLKISGTVTEIGKNAFAACEELETLIVPASVTTIGEGAFSGCVGLREIVFKGDAPEIGDSAFASVEAEATYPGGNDTWNDEMIDNYGGSIIWEPVIPECTDHVYEAVVTAPTCTEQGYTTYTCVGCGDSYVGDYTDPLNHNYEDGSCIHCGQEETEYLLGDVNGDGEVDIFDANLVVGYYNGTVTFNETQILAADVNGDGEVDIFDANLIVAYYNGTIVSFPVEE